MSGLGHSFASLRMSATPAERAMFADRLNVLIAEIRAAVCPRLKADDRDDAGRLVGIVTDYLARPRG